MGGPYGYKTRYRLAGAGTAVAIDRDRILWAATAGRHSTRIVGWDRHSSRATVLCKVVGSASSLVLSRGYAAWVTTRNATGSQVWVYDFARGRAYPGREGRSPGQPGHRRRQRVLGGRPRRPVGAVPAGASPVTRPAPAARERAALLV